MQTISVSTTQNVSIQYPIASVGDRILAYLLDRLILVGYTIAIVALLINTKTEIWWLYLILLGVPWLFYHLLFEIFMNGQSPGKRVMSIQVVRLDGTEPTIGDYLLRWIFSLVDFYLLSGALAVVIIAMGGKGQRLGDVVAGTSVVKLIAQKEITAEQVFITPEQTYTPTFPQVVQLQAKDIELIQRALEANDGYGNIQPVLVLSEKIKTMLGIETDLPAVQFLRVIAKDYNHYNAL
ncbi:RDD family protein [Chryseosolibacter indicus]|uniref:RDD family protein n=1 Tax=Chryseosolibacter indicus TaxID=2782351 RepID=A0ABS5VSI7_9BACT|nr:RDD family protein [Chryseosolibacter indicus]MBT1704398.1 RDD family protein [Chryseosolibacter indicus]